MFLEGTRVDIRETCSPKTFSLGVGKDSVIITTDRLEVSPDGKTVTAYSGAAPAPGISISAEFNTVVVNGVTIERAADGHLVISAPGTVITKPGPANDTAAKPKTAIEVGDEMPDGTIYAGVSPDTGKAMYATPQDAPGTYTFNQAAQYVGNLDAHGHHDFRAPSKSELNVLFNNRAAIGGFNVTGSNPAGWYWSFSPYGNDGAWAQRFSDGHQVYSDRDDGYSSLRCVR
jgi:hypothetical protein